ncbi:MAG: sulfatase-like hydrolase/transferase [Bacilli bacterium]|nr:sulfatase-like hydrolase/transferase [Bacilli bacterium]
MKIKSIIKQAKTFIFKFLKNTRHYLKHNILFITFVLVCLMNACALRFFTVKNFTSISPILADFAIILIIGGIGYLFKKKNRFKYYMFWTVVFTAVCVINSAYYTNYVSFTSFSLLATSIQIFGVGDALNNIIEVKDFSYILAPLILFLVKKRYRFTSFYDNVPGGKKGYMACLKTIIVGLISLGFFISTVTPTDISRLYKQWNREYVVMKFGIYTYQGNDLIASLKPQISPLFGYDKAAKEVREYYEEYPSERKENKYTDKYKNKNVIVIHAESIQNYLLDTEINGVPIAPNVKKLADEGLYFSNFYAQESVGTSSDSEFTFSTSLLPASSGTVFVSYWNREYPSIQKLLNDQKYYTFSMHANKGNFWNREVMHEHLGYKKFYNYKEAYEINDEDIIGLGLNDKSFFKQSAERLEKINNKYDKWYGLAIMLTNHTPFTGLIGQSDLDLTYHYKKTNTDGTTEEVINDYLKNRTLGNYFQTAHYADEAIGEFISELDKKGLLENTIVVIYGDHDAKIKRGEYDYYYNYNPETDSKYEKDDQNYNEFTKYDYELNRKVPFIIWTKNNQEKKEIKEIMGMYDILPTLGNMLGIHSDYALGHDLFSTDENFVVFPNGNWITNKMYYDSQSDEGILLDENATISQDYIKKMSDRADREVLVSNDIIVHDLVKKIRESNEVLKESKNG